MALNLANFGSSTHIPPMAEQIRQQTDEAMLVKAIARWEGEGGAPKEGHVFRSSYVLPDDLDDALFRDSQSRHAMR